MRPVFALLLLAGLSACKPDADGDGFKEGEDCNDEDATVMPGAVEICNGVDDDCDGVVDPTTATDVATWFADADGDSFGDAGATSEGCEAPEGFVADATDCDDVDDTSYPGAAEVCDDGIENDCDTDGLFDCAASDCAGDAACAPTITDITPDHGYEGIATSVTITGSGFDTLTAGDPVVTFGAAGDCTSLVVVDDDTITCDTPKGSAATVDVTVTTDNGSDTLALGYTFDASPIYAADGKAAASGSLYQVDVITGTVTEVGPIGFGVTGMAFSPDGTLFAVTAVNGRDAQLITIDTATGAGAVVGAITGVSYTAMPDVTFVGSRLIAWSEDGDEPYEIDTTSGAATRLGGSRINSAGSGLAYDGSTLWFVPYNNLPLYKIDPSTGVGTSTGVILNTVVGDTFNSMTFHNGTMYVVDSENLGGGGVAALSTVDTATGVVTTVVTLSDDVDAIASRTP